MSDSSLSLRRQEKLLERAGAQADHDKFKNAIDEQRRMLSGLNAQKAIHVYNESTESDPAAKTRHQELANEAEAQIINTQHMIRTFQGNMARLKLHVTQCEQELEEMGIPAQ